MHYYAHLQECKAVYYCIWFSALNPLNAELNPICHLLALLGAHHILHVGRIRVNVLAASRLPKTPASTLNAENHMQ